MEKSIDIRSHHIHYWMRWLAMVIAVVALFVLESIMQGGLATKVHQGMFMGALGFIVLLALIHRPKSFRLVLKDGEVRLQRLPGGRVIATFPAKDLRYTTVRHTGHLMNLSVLKLVVRTKQHGSRFFGPIYINGVDTVTSSEVSQLLPRVQRPEIAHSHSS